MKQLSLICKIVFFLICSILGIVESQSQSIYTKEISIPEYDSLNSEHFLIKSAEDWSYIDDEDKRYFFVNPGEYNARILIFSSGTEEKKRYLSLYTPNDLHPSKLPTNEQVFVNFQFNDAHYWIVDRISSRTFNEFYCHEVRNGSSNIIFNRLNITDFFAGMRISSPSYPPYTNNITIQNSRFDQMTLQGLDNDQVAIVLTGDDGKLPRTVLNTHIINNEIKNCNDGIGLHRYIGDQIYVDFQGTIIDNNHIYVTSDVYTNGDGIFDPNGYWALTENAIDIKGGSMNSDNPIIISNNAFWGYRRTDTISGGSGSWGSAINAHYYAPNLIMKDNLIFDSNRAIGIAAPYGNEYCVENAVIENNIFYDIGYDTDGDIGIANILYSTYNVLFQRNTIVGPQKHSYWISVNGEEVDLEISCNVVIDSYSSRGHRSGSTQVLFNTFYNTEIQEIDDGRNFESSSLAKMDDFVLRTDRYTNEPRDIIIPGVVTTKDSPHYRSCFNADEDGTSLFQNFPNPFQNSTIIEYTLNNTSFVELKIYTITGMIVKSLVSEMQPVGHYRVVFESGGFQSGFYHYRLSANKKTLARKMIIVN